MGLAMFRKTSGWLAMLCVATILALVGQSDVQAFESAEHAGHHAAPGLVLTVDADHHCHEHHGEAPAEPAGETHHHHSVDHHAVGLGVDQAPADPRPPATQAVAPTRGVHRSGLSGYGIERPPKA